MIMKNFITSYFSIVVMVIFLQHHLVGSLSPEEQKTALFQFKQSFNISTPTICYYYDYTVGSYEIPSHPKTMNWSMSSDYCTWEGITCDHKTGDVIGLDLSCSGLEGAILPNSTLFHLSHLRFLNLSNNDFSLSNKFPQEFGFFAKGLTHLNLSRTWFSGRVPSGISHLHKLLSLDLSLNYNAKLEAEVFKSLLQNLTQLRVLNVTQEEDEEEEDDYFFGGFTWEAVVIGYGCGVVPAFIAGYLMLLARKPKWFAGIIAMELGLKVRRMEIKWR